MFKTSPLRGPSALLCVAISLLSARQVWAEEFSVIVNRGNGVASLSTSDLKKLFSGGIKQWDSGAVVQVGVNVGEAPESVYLAALLGITLRELLQRMQEQVFKGEMRRPVVLRSSLDCMALARANLGTVCVASSMTPVPPEARAVPIR
jgi:hypothetical protein